MRVFYAAYLLEEPYATLINAIRLLCEPAEKHLAHLTIRGPYDEPLSPGEVEEINKMVRGISIRVLGGTFFDSTQATVYLACSASNLPLVWEKPNYDYHPHITLYDGKSLNLSRQLRTKLLRYRITFNFAIDSLYPLMSTPGQQDLTLRASIPESFVRAFFTPLGRTLNEALQLPEEIRLLLIDELLRVLTNFSSEESSDRIDALRKKQQFDFASLLNRSRLSFGCA